MGKKILFLILALLIVSSVSAQSTYVANSRDWVDVLSVELFGNLQNIDTKFVTGSRQSTILHFTLPEENIQVISSVDNPYVVGYDNMLESQGKAQVSELAFDNVNLELARRLPGVNKYIVIDDSYGYNALAAAPLASLDGYYILFADDRTIGDISNFLESKNVEEIIIFGQVDREVKDALAQFNPETINTGDRFENNIEMVKKYLEIRPTTQVVLTNGEFIEQSIIDGYDPVLFIGNANVPDQIQEFIKNSDIDIGILVGNELIGTATIIRRQVGISVFVKFAQGARTPGGSISAVEDLDKFPMPTYSLDLSIFSVFYNQATGVLEVTYRNDAELATYFLSTITVISGESVQQAVPDEEGAIFIDGEEFKTILYQLANPLEDDATAEFYTIFGESPRSLEFALQGTFPIEFISVRDESAINITDLYYDGSAFYIEIENIGEVDVYVDAELLDLYLNGQYITVGGDEVILIKPGKKGKIKVTVELDEVDIGHRLNQEIDVRVLYGQRENSLIKSMKAKFAFKMKEGDMFTYVLIALIIVLLLLILFTRKKKCKNCKHKNPRKRMTCEKCGEKL